MNKPVSHEQDLYDELRNLVTTLSPIIVMLNGLIEQADNVVADRLNTSLDKIDRQVYDVTVAIKKLSSTASVTSQSLSEYQALTLEQLQVAVTAFTKNELPSRYDDKIKALINEIKQQLDIAVTSVVTAKNKSLEDQVGIIKEVADKLSTSATNLALFTSQYQAGHEQIIKDIETLETATKTRIAQVKEDADKDLDKIYKSIESMSIKRIAAAAAAATAAVVMSVVGLVFWYVPSFDEVAEMRHQQAELQRGIDELEMGWQQAFDKAISAKTVFACDVNKEKPDVISWCVRADSNTFLRDDKGVVYYKIAELKERRAAE
ncbi:hypothetical protein [Psychrobacter urativorans]|uniref:Uncharacterized protein n=1 Tax=Psychrobacter urativorans TaxID=45610 RepID=A0A0M3V9M4_9GAMM|nr:hypothetical protein [Psychrobacter urativorans]ALF60927.1 hypothetical protein AOC03_12125 [Psychrobacter urativorans]